MIKKVLYFDSGDGKSKIYAVQYIPEEKEIIGVVQIVYGMAEHIGRYETFAEAMVQKGFVVTGHDCLGHGKTLKEDAVAGYFCKEDPATVVIEDVHTLHRMTVQEYSKVPYILLGHSMGSFVVRNYMSRYGQELSAAILLGRAMQGKATIAFGKTLNGISKILFGSKHISKLLNYLSFGGNIKHFQPARTPSDWLTRDEQVVDRYNEDPLCGFLFTVNGFETMFELISRMNQMNTLRNIPKELPILIMSGSEDPVGAFGKGPKKVYELMENTGHTKVHFRIYDGARHELLNETNREEVIQDISDWIGRIL